jgi:hypothetical protein
MRKEWIRVTWPKQQRTFGVCQGKLLVPKIPITAVWLCSEGPDQEVKRERVASVSATKVICWPATVPITLDSMMFVGGAKGPLASSLQQLMIWGFWGSREHQGTGVLTQGATHFPVSLLSTGMAQPGGRSRFWAGLGPVSWFATPEFPGGVLVERWAAVGIEAIFCQHTWGCTAEARS